VKTYDELHQMTYIVAVNAETGEVLNGGPVESPGGQLAPLAMDGNRVYQTTITNFSPDVSTYVTIFEADTGHVVGGGPLEIVGYATSELQLGSNDRGYLLLDDYSGSTLTSQFVVINTADRTLVGGQPIDLNGPRSFFFVIHDDDVNDVHRAYVT